MSIARSLLAIAAVSFVAACGGANKDGDTTATATDTSVTTKTVQDTAVITTDTTIKTDTNHVGGGTTGAHTTGGTPATGTTTGTKHP